MRAPTQHAEWLSLIEVSGPFVAPTVLREVFPQGLDVVETETRQRLRAAYSELSLAIEEQDPELQLLHDEWINFVLRELLEFDEDDLLRKSKGKTSKYTHSIAEHQVTLEPDLAVVNGDIGLLLLANYPSETKLDAPLKTESWAASPLERMVLLCRSTGVQFGLVTNGERWTFINAQVGQSTTYASWYARLWVQEADTLRAFASLLGIRRFYAPAEEQLNALLLRSLDMQQEISSKLSEQVGQAIEVLVQSLDRAHLADTQLLEGVSPPELYEAGLTVMMRLVFLLCAEERDLLLSDEPLYESNYALSPLRSQLAEEADRHGPELLERRQDAWPRLLALFRAVYGGIEHESLRLPPLGGSLFDPDRFPFLEGRAKGSSWREEDALPLPIDNRTVLLLLEALQVLDGQTLSYRALDVEHIGYVYEGLLESTVKRLASPSLKLIANKGAIQTVFSIDELEEWSASSSIVDKLADYLKRAKSAIGNALNKKVEPKTLERLIIVCGDDRELAARMAKFAGLVANDNWGYPRAYQQGSYVVASYSGRRDSGSHYTPQSLTEAIVEETLTPVAYTGPAKGTPREKWQLKSAEELLELKVCDPAMGSGAFLVQVCRWLSERLLEAWASDEASSKFVCIDGHVHDDIGGRDPMPDDKEERLIQARRLVAERCLYGVDLNPLAVELAKLSIWLVTVAKGRPFGFLDHNLKHGDSLLGVTSLDQVTHLHIDPKRGKTVHRGLFNRHKQIRDALALAVQKRMELRELPILDIYDVERMEALDAEARELLEPAELIADAVVGEALAAPDATSLDRRMKIRAEEAARHLSGDLVSRQLLVDETRRALAIDNPTGNIPRQPFHWAMEFPEVFMREDGGFDAMVGNPPFIGGQKITGVMGTSYREYLVNHIADGKRGSADLVAYFFVRAFGLLRKDRIFGLIATKTIAEGDTRKVGLENLCNDKENGLSIISSTPGLAWPGEANLFVSVVIALKGRWIGACRISGAVVSHISPYLNDRQAITPNRLNSNLKMVYQGVVLSGRGFLLDIHDNTIESKVTFPYLIGDDVNGSAEHNPSRQVICFFDWSLQQAEDFPNALNRLKDKVKPVREKNNREVYRKYWWHYAEKRPALFEAIGRGSCFQKKLQEKKRLEKVIVFSRAGTKYPCFALVNNTSVYADTVGIIASDKVSLFTILSSDIHGVWAWEQKSSKGEGLRYSHTDIFETFAFPKQDFLITELETLRDIGKEYLAKRSDYMLSHNKGMTKFYNDFHDPELSSPELIEMRELQVKLNQEVLRQYGWEDIELNHGFHEVAYLPESKRTRYTVSEEARFELLKRLSELNRKRYEAEQAASPAKAKRKTATKTKPKVTSKKVLVKAIAKPTVKPISTESQLDLAGMGNQWGSNTVDQILAWLEHRKTWADQHTILNGCEANPREWDAAIKELLEEDFIEQKGTGANTQYRAKT